MGTKHEQAPTYAEEIRTLEADLIDEVEDSMRWAIKHGNQPAATKLNEIAKLAFGHIDRPDGFSAAVEVCFEGGPTHDGNPDDVHLDTCLFKVKEITDELAALKSGKQRPKSTMPQGGPGIEEIKSIKFSDRANAERLEAVYKNELRHCSGQWYEWNFTNWRPDSKGAHLRAKTIGQDIREELLTDGVSDPELAKHYFRAAKGAESSRGIRDTLDLAHSMHTFNGDDIEWDADPWLLNCSNGTVNLETGNLQRHKREDYIARLCSTEYLSDALAPRWIQFLHEIFSGDEELIRYVQWCVGYSLTALTRHHLFFVLWGGGANGKTTFIEVLKHIVGVDYFHMMTSDDLLMNNQPRHLSPVAQLAGKRFVVASETNENRRLDESRVKSITGGDSLRANLMRCDAKEFTPVCKLWLSTNHRPVIRDDSKGMWRRIRLIPFLESFEDDKADANLADELKGEAEGILAWAVDGAKRVAAGEPEVPTAVQAAVSEYKEEQNTLGQFVEEECKIDGDLRVGKTLFYDALNAWSRGRCGTRKEVARRMLARPEVGEGYLHGGRAAWTGLALAPVDHDLGGGQ